MRLVRTMVPAVITLPYIWPLFAYGKVLQRRYSLLAVAFSFMLFGAYFYASKYPESKIRGAYCIDYFLSSHKLWHYFNLGFDLYMHRFTMQCYTDGRAKQFKEESSKSE